MKKQIYIYECIHIYVYTHRNNITTYIYVYIYIYMLVARAHLMFCLANGGPGPFLPEKHLDRSRRPVVWDRAVPNLLGTRLVFIKCPVDLHWWCLYLRKVWEMAVGEKYNYPSKNLTCRAQTKKWSNICVLLARIRRRRLIEVWSFILSNAQLPA